MTMSEQDIPASSYDSARVLMQALKVVDPLTFYHCCRVGEYSRLLARDAGLDPYEQKKAEFTGLLHDIGKIAVPQLIIHKPAKLDNDEFAIMKKHPELSEEVVQVLADNPFFKELLGPIRAHHERMDGRGYPDGLAGEQIPVVARIVLIADTYDAMTQTRSYRKGLPVEAVFAELQKYAGTQFDPNLAEVFMRAQPTWKIESNLETYDKIFKKTA
jgi:HD-GYP domain-containing protein (c-di-GMP phosphodiesterase class II)